MRFIHSDDIIEKFPGNYTCIIGNVHTDKIENLGNTILELKKKIKIPNDYINESVLIWKDIYSRMGAKKKYKSSLGSLVKYYIKHNRVYNISPIVDFYNLYSLYMSVSIGAFDEEKIKEEIVLRKARNNDCFRPLGQNQIIKLNGINGNEVVYSDKEKVICRYWNFRDSDETKITDMTNKVVFIFDLIDTSMVSAREKYKTIIDDFKAIFPEDIFHGITGKGLNNVLIW